MDNSDYNEIVIICDDIKDNYFSETNFNPKQQRTLNQLQDSIRKLASKNDKDEIVNMLKTAAAQEADNADRRVVLEYLHLKFTTFKQSADNQHLQVSSKQTDLSLQTTDAINNQCKASNEEFEKYDEKFTSIQNGLACTEELLSSDDSWLQKRKEQLKAKQNERKELDEKINFLGSENTKLREKQRLAEQENEDLKNVSINIQEEVDRLNEDLSALNVTKKQLEAQKLNSQKANEDIKHALSMLQNEIVKLNDEFEPLRITKKKLETQKSNIQKANEIKFDQLHSFVQKSVPIIKDFCSLGLRDSYIDKCIAILKFNKAIATPKDYMDILDHPPINWTTRLVYSMETIALHDKKTLSTLKELAKKLSISLIYAQENERYDTLAHTALSEELNRDVGKGRVIKTVKAGLRTSDTILHKAKVILSK